jgi:hypothetical protein
MEPKLKLVIAAVIVTTIVGVLLVNRRGHSHAIPGMSCRDGAEVNTIMHPFDQGGREINRNERGAYASPVVQPWNSR